MKGLHIILFVVGTLFIGISAYQLSKSIKLMYSGTKTTGEVIQIKEVIDSEGTSYHPIIQYNNNGINTTLDTEPALSKFHYEIGEKILLIYDEQLTKVYSFWGIFRWTYIPFIIGSAFWIVSIGFYFFIKRTTKSLNLSTNEIEHLLS